MTLDITKIRAHLQVSGGAALSLARYATDPIGFARHVLGVELTAIQQKMLIDASTNLRFAVACGQRTGRTMVFAVLLIWWCATRRDARALLSTPSNSHMRSTDWRQIGELIRNAKEPIGATWYELPSRGVQFDNGNEIIGIASDTGERLQGYAAPNLYICVDEAAGYPENLIQPLMSNLAGGGHVAIGGNPTNNSSYFAKRWGTPGWVTSNVSALDVANSNDRQPGQATPEWCAEMAEEYGVDSLIYRARVLGIFSGSNANSVFTLLEIEQAMQRFDDAGGMAVFQKAGPLEIGVDVARSGMDFSIATARRGHMALAPRVWKIADLVAVADEVARYAADLRIADERVTVRIDGVGVGAGVVDILKRDPRIKVVDVQAAAKPFRDAYTNVRAEAIYVARDWVRAGGCIARDPKLEAEMAALTYTYDARNKLKILPKDELRRALGRSTDRLDSLVLALYVPPKSGVMNYIAAMRVLADEMSKAKGFAT